MSRGKKDDHSAKEFDRQLAGWIKSEKGRETIISDIETKWGSATSGVITDSNADNDKIRRRVLSAIKNKVSAPENLMPKKKIWLKWASVAAIVLIAGLGGWLYIDSHLFDPESRVISVYNENIVLTLPDGSQMILDHTTENSLIAQHGDVHLNREEGKLIHTKLTATDGTSPELQWSSIEVPRGKNFDLILQDGTRVSLNAGSRLRFPIDFVGAERRVFLDGEGYFAVTGNEQKPFIVETSLQMVEVLGTEFNIYAYPGDSAEHTTLVEGIVSVRHDDDTRPEILSPGQQAVLSRDSDTCSITEVNTARVCAWRNNTFVFDGITLEQVFEKLARWYDMNYHFEDLQAAGLIFRGNIGISDNVESILESLEALGSIEIIVKGKNVTIKTKQ